MVLAPVGGVALPTRLVLTGLFSPPFTHDSGMHVCPLCRALPEFLLLPGVKYHQSLVSLAVLQLA